MRQIQQNDPVAQAMAILQLVTQRRGQQANVDQGNRQLDLQQQQMQQRQEQFNQGFQWDREQAAVRNKQFEQELAQKQLQQTMENVARERQLQGSLDYQGAIAEKIRRDLANQSKDPQTMMAENERAKMIVASLQEQMNLARNPIEASRINDQIQAYLRQLYGNQIPPLRDYTESEQNAMKAFGM